MFNRLHAQRCGNVGLTRSWSSHENHVVGILQELTAVQLPNQGFIDLAVAEVEARQVSIGREPCHLELIGHRAYLPFGGLSRRRICEPSVRVRSRMSLNSSAVRNRVWAVMVALICCSPTAGRPPS